MRYREWREFRKVLGLRKIFSSKDLATYFVSSGRLTPESLRVILFRAVKEGILWRLCKGWYAFSDDLPSPDEAAMEIVWPSYVSMERALSLEGVLSQGIYTITLMSPRAWQSKRPFVLKYPDGAWPVEVYYVRVIPEELLGKVAPPEVALVDLLLVRRKQKKNLIYLRHLLDGLYWDEINFAGVERILKERGKESDSLRLDVLLPETIAKELGIERWIKRKSTPPFFAQDR